MAFQPLTRRLIAWVPEGRSGDPKNLEHLMAAFAQQCWKVRLMDPRTAWTAALRDRQVRAVLLAPGGSDPKVIAGLAALQGVPSSTRPIVAVLCPAGDPALPVSMLEAGADLAISETSDPALAAAQVLALVRLVNPALESSHLHAGSLSLDLANRLLSMTHEGARREMTLSATECRFMRALLSFAHQPQSRQSLVEAIWGADSRIEPRTIDVHVRRLRGLLARIGCDHMLQTVRGIGYRFDPD